jgi:prepilin-type processing-associated H-X9-DG protein
MLTRRRGFSRLETLLVGATGIVAMLTLPAMSQGLNHWFGTRGTGDRLTTCQGKLKQTALGVMQYVQDYDEKYPIISSGPVKSNYGWVQNIDPYVRSRELFSCPLDRHPLGNDAKKARYTDYWYNRNLNGVELAKVSEPARTLLMGDGDGNSPQSNARYSLDTLPKSWKTIKGSPATRHEKGANYSFADGHVKWYLPTQIYTASPVKNKSLPATFAVR